ncbi:MAG: hypothetical protein P8K08_05885 [Fuerstiella sp.]|nr:hypothetical protein [Fuerstiella sp.]
MLWIISPGSHAAGTAGVWDFEAVVAMASKNDRTATRQTLSDGASNGSAGQWPQPAVRSITVMSGSTSVYALATCGV